MLNQNVLFASGDNVLNALDELIGKVVEKRIVKLTFFVGIADDEQTAQISGHIEKQLSKHLGANNPGYSLVAQAPFEATLALEYMYVNESEDVIFKTIDDLHYVLIQGSSNYLFLNGVTSGDDSLSVYQQSEIIFNRIKTLLSGEGFPLNSIQRQWNYIPHITEVEQGNQNYQQFNDVRSTFYSEIDWNKGYPAATGIGVSNHQVVVDIIAVDNLPVSRTIDNKYQTTAHSYSDEVLEENSLGEHRKTTPKFERGRLINEAVFISGTASITGEDSIHIGLPAEQTHLSIENIQHLLDELDSLNVQMNLNEEVVVRVYIKNESDFEVIKAICHKAYKGCQIIYVNGDVCRPELLVEIELMRIASN